MGESSKCQTVLPESLWADDPVQQKRSGKFLTGRDNATRSQTLIDRSYRFGIPIKAHRNAPPLSTVKEEQPKDNYHKSYDVDQAGYGMIALKDVEGFPTFLIKKHQIPKSWTFQEASHKNLVPLTEFYTESSSICLVYEYMHLAIPLGGLAGVVDFSEADIATICREILDGLVYIHSKLGISHGSVDCSNVLLNRKGEIQLANIGLWRQYVKQQHTEQLEGRCSSCWFHCDLSQ
ncbi:uncharacterized protein ASPGLDRAFT_48091 [Aspergillus glaucus CBS 516.65]|uniref:Protein kinase domain-containing protein n=1 Tax=Aspergillus glaucus CBS 516.65 TaxID=1160497 RepID=A0A1L9VI39_ASPGL|nr:hypothetical protein ASPGLDRAFT_48091 [Aspergillus glaucus CBS 516.65]OJJ83542.1 hypothetical protein ASPGLDRAFT_48091 [Aspergillus glaucus CBS 516.65]